MYEMYSHCPLRDYLFVLEVIMSMVGSGSYRTFLKKKCLLAGPDQNVVSKANYNIFKYVFIFCLTSVFSLMLTVRGMMYYKRAIKLQAFLDMTEDKGL